VLEDASAGQIVEELSDRSQVLLDRGLGQALAELLDKRRDRDGLDLVELEVVILTPMAELYHRPCIGGSRAAIADARGKELDEPQLARSPRARVMAGSASSPARTSAGGVNASVSRIGGAGIKAKGPPGYTLFPAHIGSLCSTNLKEQGQGADQG
jgi:hypothetical protein